MNACYCTGECRRTGRCPAAGREILPVIPLLPDRWAQTEYVAQCECGRRIPRGADGYCCSNPRCPIQPRTTL